MVMFQGVMVLGRDRDEEQGEWLKTMLYPAI